MPALVLLVLKRTHYENKDQSDTTRGDSPHELQPSIQNTKKQKIAPPEPLQRQSESALPAPSRKTLGGKTESAWVKTLSEQRERQRPASDHRRIAPKPARRKESASTSAASHSGRGQSWQQIPAATPSWPLPTQSYYQYGVGHDTASGVDDDTVRSVGGLTGLAGRHGSNTGFNNAPMMAGERPQRLSSHPLEARTPLSGDASKAYGEDTIPADAHPQAFQLDLGQSDFNVVGASTDMFGAEGLRRQVPPIGQALDAASKGTASRQDAIHMETGDQRPSETITPPVDQQNQGFKKVARDPDQGGQQTGARRTGLPAKPYRVRLDEINQLIRRKRQAQNGDPSGPSQDRLTLTESHNTPVPPLTEPIPAPWRNEEVIERNPSFTTEHMQTTTHLLEPILAGINLWHPMMTPEIARRLSGAVLAGHGVRAFASWNKAAEDKLARLRQRETTQAPYGNPLVNALGKL